MESSCRKCVIYRKERENRSACLPTTTALLVFLLLKLHGVGGVCLLLYIPFTTMSWALSSLQEISHISLIVLMSHYISQWSEALNF